ncbi:MAG: FHA domain-containing protein [Myxococcota bacterium]
MAGPAVFVVAGDGRLRVGPAGVLLGRAPTCDVVLADEAASRHHALVVREAEGAALVAMGRHGVTVNGAPSEGGPLAHGDRVGVPGLEVRIEVEPGDPTAPGLLAADGGPTVRVGARFTVGAGGDLALPGVPAGALALEPGPDRLRVTGGVPWHRNGVAVAAGWWWGSWTATSSR